MDERRHVFRRPWAVSRPGAGGAMGERVRAMDWTYTPLGPIRRWPSHLCQAAELCLDCGFAAALCWGPQFVLIYNDAYADILGDKHPDALGRPVREVLPELHDFLEPSLQAVMSRGEALHFTDRRFELQCEGRIEERYFDLALSPVRSAGGEIEGVFNTAIETTARVTAARQAAERAELLSYITTAADIGCWDWDVVADRGSCTEICRTIFALPPDKPLSYACFLDTLHPEDRARTDAAMQRALAKGGDYDVEYRIVRPGGGERWVQSKGKVDFAPDGRPHRMAGIVVDVTGRKSAELELAASKARLEDEVAARTAQLVAANKELQGFAYGVAHDLKSPLRGIVSYSQLLNLEFRERLGDGGSVFLEQIEKSAARMRALIDDLLAYSRIEQGGKQLQPLDLQAALGRLLLEREEDIRRGGVQLRVDLPPVRILGEAEGLDQVLRNLIDNALKFSAKATPPVIEIGGEKSSGRCRVWVKDNGLGFDMAQHERIFEIFQRLHRADDIPGTGIGLALVKKAMERIGGRVWAESTPGGGATFFLELPVQENETFG